MLRNPYRITGDQWNELRFSFSFNTLFATLCLPSLKVKRHRDGNPSKKGEIYLKFGCIQPKEPIVLPSWPTKKVDDPSSLEVIFV